MTGIGRAAAIGEGHPVGIPCADGVTLSGRLWRASEGGGAGRVVVNPATGVRARYYHRYARFLAGHGFDVLTYDYRGIGESRGGSLRGSGIRWRDWGERDVDGALRFMEGLDGAAPLLVVGHSIGGFLAGLAPRAVAVDRLLTVGAQHAFWMDYAPRQRAQLLLKWHVAMPALTAVCGYFPGRRLGWLEDLPAGVVREWSFGGRRFGRGGPLRQSAAAAMAAVTAPILAVAVADDPLGTVPAIRRALSYYTAAPRTLVRLRPADYGRSAIGHFDFFHDRHATGFWTESLAWLRHGENPWSDRVVTT